MRYESSRPHEVPLDCIGKSRHVEGEGGGGRTGEGREIGGLSLKAKGAGEIDI